MIGKGTEWAVVALKGAYELLSQRPRLKDSCTLVVLEAATGPAADIRDKVEAKPLAGHLLLPVPSHTFPFCMRSPGVCRFLRPEYRPLPSNSRRPSASWRTACSRTFR